MNTSWPFLSPFFIYLLFLSASITAQPINVSSIHSIDNNNFEIILNITIPTGDTLYADYLSFSTDHPAVTITTWHPSCEPISKYDVTFKTTKKIFLKSCTITIQLHSSDTEVTQFNLYANFYLQSKKHIEYAILPIDVRSQAAVNATVTPAPKQLIGQSSIAHPVATPSNTKTISSLHDSLALIMQTTDSWSVRLLLAMFLGFLLSLTPCIYPMIPITMGILQSHGSKSMRRNFLLSLTYIAGIAVTFSLLGLMAAWTGKMFGSIMNNPFVIACIVALLIYLAGSMLGLYEMYIPRFLQPQHSSFKGGSLLSVFLFGAVSGTVASPCLSPGLLLLLTIVTSIGSSFFGFALLFSFGFGLGIPLLIIGTFSSSLNMLPRAGSWMVDIKQFFGFIILATCFYFISIFVPSHILSWAIAFFIACVGLFYLVTASHSKKIARTIKNWFGVICIAASIYAFFYAYKITDTYYHQSCESSNWLVDVQEALEKAKNCGKLLLIDISAPYCSICKAIDKKLFAHQTIKSFLPNLIALKINDIDSNNNTQKMGATFKIVGAPTVILYDPITDKELQRWGAELYEYIPEQFIAEIEKHLH